MRLDQRTQMEGKNVCDECMLAGLLSQRYIKYNIIESGNKENSFPMGKDCNYTLKSGRT